jgi:lysophospholipase L1-like esterase
VSISTIASSAGVAAAARTAITGVGDSIMAYGDGVGAGGSAGPTSSSIIAWGMSQLGLPYSITANRGVAGSTIDGILSGQLSAAMADNSDILWIHSGINHLNPSIDASAPTVAQIVSNMRRLLSKATSKPLVILDALTPLAADSISGALPRVADIPLVNAGYRALTAEFKNVVFNDVYTPLALDAVSGLARPGMTLASDGIHLTSAGAYTAGVATAQNVAAAAISLRPSFRTLTYFDLPTFTGSSGTTTASTGSITGTVATGCNVQIASNATGVVVTASVGTLRDYTQRLRIQNGNASATVVRLQQASFTSPLTGLSSGDVLRFSGSVHVVAGQTGLYRQDLAFQQDPSGSTVSFPSLQKSPKEDGSGDSFPSYPTTDYTTRLCGVATLTATPTTANVVWSIEVAPGGDVTLDFEGWRCEKVTAV